MKKNNASKGIIKRIIANREITKGKLLRSLLTGFAVPFLLLICASFSVYFANYEELGFSLADFAPLFLLASAVAFAGITLVLLLTKKWLHNLIFALCAGLVICAHIQTLITNFTFKGLPGDGNALPASSKWIIADLLLWFAIFGVVFWFCVISKKAKIGRNVSCFLLCLALVMQSVSLIPSAIGFLSERSNKDSLVYLTTENMFEVSDNKNVIVFILDRFDIRFYNRLEETYPEVLEELDGFTLYEDNISKYPRTFPSITYLLTGKDYDFTTQTHSEYMDSAFETSPFMSDLEENNYNINLYIPYYNAYSRTTNFNDAVTNAAKLENYTIASPLNFSKKILKLSSYFWLPDRFKSKTISSTSFYNNIVFRGNSPEYSLDISSDSEVYAEFSKTGLSVQNEKNNFTFLHLRGCHPPFSIDENGTYQSTGNITWLQQTRGCFKFITEYLSELKALGLYDDATIIITGDHGALRGTDADLYTDSILTTLLVKESDKSATPLKKSSSPVSQDNFIATIVKSAQIQTNNDYGKACDEVSENEIITRTHHFQSRTGNAADKEVNYTYTITGSAADFNNWEITNREEVVQRK